MRVFNIFCCVFAIALISGTARAAEPIDFVRDVQPILAAHCVSCHADDEPEGGFAMDSFAKLMQGGKTGVAITAGAPSSSRLLLMVTGKLAPVMPPEDEERLTEAEVEMLTAWIDQGAVGPAGDIPLKREIRTPHIAPQPGVAQPLTAIAYSADGQLRAVGRYGSVQIFSQDDSVVTTITDPLKKVNSIQFSKDGKRVLVASGVTGAYGTAAIFSTESGQLIREFVDHRDVLYAAVFSPDEKTLATAGYDRQIILWNVDSGEAIHSLTGHNGAIFDLAFSPDGKVLASACADETVKIWNTATGQRLDTLSQPEGEVFAVGFSNDGRFILAGSADNRLRVWSLRSIEVPQINPIVATRFVDESPLINFTITPDGKTLLVLSADGHVKLIDTVNWNQVATLEPLAAAGTDLAISPDGTTVLLTSMDGTVVRRALPTIESRAAGPTADLEKIYLDLGALTQLEEAKLRESAAANQQLVAAGPVPVDRGVQISGMIAQAGEADAYQWSAKAGEVWAIDADAAANSAIDPLVTVLDANGQPILRARLQAVRDSYFTFRGKDSTEIGDFRLFNWEEMHLDDYLYAAGEVTRLFMHPRGPDSGFNVYPNEGVRWTYFGTSPATHALGEPAYVVQELPAGAEPVANGLPVFNIYYENDDDPVRLAGKNSRIVFHAPADGLYTCRIADTRGAGGENFGYQVAIRAAAPGFSPSVGTVSKPLRRGMGREFIVRVDRMDGFDGEVTFDIPDLPAGLVANVPLTIEAGQRYAVGTIWVSETAEAWEGKRSPEVIARAEVAGRIVERKVGSVGELTLEDRPSVIASVHPLDRTVAENENWTLTVRRGETVSARVVVRRKEGFTTEVSFGKENAGRNTAHGVYVDNIGLNGLLVREGEDSREFFLTADPIAQPGKRSFFLTGEVDGNVTTHPITVEVLP